MEQISHCQLKVIDFNHARMFQLEDSPFRLHHKRKNLPENLTDCQIWKEMSGVGQYDKIIEP